MATANSCHANGVNEREDVSAEYVQRRLGVRASVLPPVVTRGLDDRLQGQGPVAAYPDSAVGTGLPCCDGRARGFEPRHARRSGHLVLRDEARWDGIAISGRTAYACDLSVRTDL